MTRNLLWRGMLAGILAALFAMVFARLDAEPQIDRAIGYENAHEVHAAGHAMGGDDEQIVSRDTQKGAGLLTALVMFGSAIGGIFSLLFAFCYGRIGSMGPRSLALLLAFLAFLVVVLVPDLKYPPTPPAVGRPETIGVRTAAYFGMIALSLIGVVAASQLRKIMRSAHNGIDATLLAVLAYGLVVGAGQFLLPRIDEVPADFPATVLWNFRIASIGTQALLWGTIGISFGFLAERLLKRQ